MKRTALSLAALMLSADLSAQVPVPQPETGGSDITNIIRDILGEAQIAFPPPPGTDTAQSAGLDNIPVSIDMLDGTAFDGEWLVVKAFAPPPPNQPRAKGELLGETRLLLRGLMPPLTVIIAAPKAVTAELNFADIRGHIEDKNGNTILMSTQPYQYSGTEAAQLLLAPPPSAEASADLPIKTIVGFEQTQGQVDISKPDSFFRGAVLTVQLTESGLVGGTQSAVKGETQIIIDRQRPPFKFTLEYGVPQDGFDMPMTLSAFITDWAGRKTHVMAKPLDFNGPNYDYRMTVDAFKQGQEVTNFEFSSPDDAARTNINGQAVFNAYKGIERDSVLKIRLLNPLSTDPQTREISTTIVSLNGLSGNVDFSASAPSLNFDPELPAPLMEVLIINPAGDIIFESDAKPVDPMSFNVATLTPRPSY